MAPTPEDNIFRLALYTSPDAQFAIDLDIDFHDDGRRVEVPLSSLLQAINAQEITEESQLVIFTETKNAPAEVTVTPDDPNLGYAFASGLARIDPEARTITVSGNAIDLTVKEFNILLFLAQRQDRIVMYREIKQQVWGSESAKNVSTHSLAVLISRLREKLNQTDNISEVKTGGVIRTIDNIGYMLLSDWPPVAF